MPSVVIYVKAPVARELSHRWGLDSDQGNLQELIRQISAEALDQAAGVSYPKQEFSDTCPWQHLHREGRRCRHCGGS
jgi:hypothetical protein